MAFRNCYSNYLSKNNIKLLVIRQGTKDTLVGYRLYNYDVVSDTQTVYDFAIDGDEIKSFPNGNILHDFLTELTPKLARVSMIPDGRGGFTTNAEVASKYRVTELKGKKIVEPLCKVIKSYCLQGKYSLSKCKNL